jgi:hypothetical protein
LHGEYDITLEACEIRLADDLPQDIGMMMANGGCERTEAQWQSIISAAGLKIIEIWYPGDDKEGNEGVIECRID